MAISGRITCCLISVSAAALLLSGCGKKQSAKEVTKTESATVSESTEAAAEQSSDIVCIWEGVPLRETAARNGKWLTGIALGEVVKDLGETYIDSSDKNREYIKVALSDGKSGWAASYGLVRNARLAVVKDPAVLFKRPDVLTMSNEKMNPMDIVAISEEKDDFIQVIGENRKKSGWIKKEFVTESREDVAMAVFISKKMKETDKLTKAEKLSKIIELAPYPGSMFVDQLKTMLEAEEAAAATPEVTPVSEEPSTTESEEEIGD